MSLPLNAAVVSGQFSTLTLLAQDALRELGESSPTILITAEEKRFINYGNLVVQDVNRHPYFQDIVLARFGALTASVTDGSAELSDISGGDGQQALVRGLPIRVTAAGHGGGDLYTYIMSNDTDGVFMAHEAETTAAATTVDATYKNLLRRYLVIGDTRAIDDRVVVEGIKHYHSIDDVSSDMPGPVQIYNTMYYQTLSGWLAEQIGAYGPLETLIRDA